MISDKGGIVEGRRDMFRYVSSNVQVDNTLTLDGLPTSLNRHFLNDFPRHKQLDLQVYAPLTLAA
ncbi:CLUMA_CG013212, isoform A [Clunio marinus]|uniref:CLUMA_CG013212, isoform A n=1 Tax=Clunio marinus TaxID=568069 RepID=A0A1J1II30_9DIPT|nr:CLUMA_CG013212, isoform A [Clunio marinus]